MAEQSELSHGQIVRAFLGSGAVNFDELGKFVAELGDAIVLSGRGDYGVRFGQHSIWACFNNIAPAYIAERSLAGLAGQVTGAAGERTNAG